MEGKSHRPPKTDNQVGEWLRQAGLLTAIPFVLLVGPVLGYYLGMALDRRWSFAPWGMAGGIALGCVASARSTMRLIRDADIRTRKR